jgi:hypothetical protein
LIGFGFAGGGLSRAPISPGFVIVGCAGTEPGAYVGSGAPAFTCVGGIAGAVVIG